MKLAKVVPTYKGGSIDDHKNYIPIVVLPVFPKIFKECLKERLLGYFEKKNLFSYRQHGFRKNRSVRTVIADVLGKITKAVLPA